MRRNSGSNDGSNHGSNHGINHGRSLILVGVVVAVALALGLWKYWTLQAGTAAMPEMPESVTVEKATPRTYQPSVGAVGTVIALRSVTLRNEVAGTVSSVKLISGDIVNTGDVLVRLDTRVEEAELAAQKAEAELARTRLERSRRLVAQRAEAVDNLEQAEAQYNVMRAQVDRTSAIIARKVLKAPFRARVGIADIHPGQYLEEGTQLTTLQGIDAAVHVDFVVSQQVAASLRTDAVVEVIGEKANATDKPLPARIVAVDARVDPRTRNATVRARIDTADHTLAPGASVRVRVPSGPERTALVLPASALRRSAEGDHVFVIATANGEARAKLRRVQTGSALGDEVLIEGGLKADEVVATAGSFKLRDNALVVVATPAPAPLAAH